MVMRGFKSFAKHTELVFGSDFNCVLGPNGSGKSNVLDALCFVLGKSSAKSMRAEKSSNLIYNGGKGRKPAKEGEVSIYFDNASKRFPTDDPEVKITRIVRQSGQSVYRINDKTRTRQEIVDLLSFAKIDPDGYNVILQGDITRFVEMPPVERRMLIEDVSGISIYEEKKQKAESQLERVGERLKEAEIVLAERNTYLKELKKDRDQAQKFKEMSDKLSQNKATLLKLQIDKKSKSRDDLASKLTKAKEELDKINDVVNTLKKENEEKKLEIENISKEIEEKGEVEQVKLNRDIEELKIDLTKKQSRLETLKNELTKIDSRKTDLESSLKEAEDKISTLIEQKDQLSKDHKKVLNEKEELNKKIGVFRDKNKLQDLANVEKQIEDIDKAAESLQKEAHELREKQHDLIRKKDLVDHQITTIDEQIAKVQEVEKEHKKEIDALKEKKAAFKKATLDLNKALNEDSSLALQIDNNRTKVSELHEALAKLQARKTHIHESTRADNAVKEILKRNISGVHGTISELGSVPSKYSLALEIAAGSRLKSIVVDNEKIASDQIKYLKKTKSGIATFLPINKIRAKKIDDDVRKAAKQKGAHGLAVDLIKFDDRFRNIFEYVFSNTIIVDDIDAARNLGIGKARMVTLDGDMAEVSGAMQGGFRKKRQGLGFSEKEITEELDKAEAAVQDTESTLSTLENRRKENEESIVKLREEKAHLEGDILKVEKSLHLNPTDLDNSKNQKQDLFDQSKDLQGEIDEVVNSISAKNKELANNRIEKEQLKAQISSLRDPALLAELATYEEKRNELTHEISRLDTELKNIDSQIQTIHEPEKQKIASISKQQTKEKDEFKTEIEFIEKETKEKQDQLKAKEAQSKEFHTKFRALFEKRQTISEEISKNDLSVSKKIDESRAVEINQNTLTLKHAEAQSEIAGLEQEFSEYEGVQIIENRTEDQLKYEISKFEKMKNEIGSVNMKALEIYDSIEKEYNVLLEKKDTLEGEKDDVVKMMEEIEQKKKDLFMKHYESINGNFQTIFSQLTSKGEALLELEDKENPFEGGLGVKVRISGQKYLDIRSLSGGEKTLTALAFIFAIQEYEPASFYVLDEVDAALDKRNAEKLAKLVFKYSEKAQYVIISHNDGVISSASTLYGISMDENGVSKVVSLRV